MLERRSKWDKPRYFAQAPGLQKHPVCTNTRKGIKKASVSDHNRG